MAITSLFGPSPAEIIMAQQKEAQQQNMLRNQQIAQQGREFGVFAPLYQAGLRFGDVGAQAMTQALFPQQVDPRLQEATAVQSVLSKYADQDQSNPLTLEKIGRDLMPVAPDAGIRALTLAKQLTKDKKLTIVSPGASAITEAGEVVYTAPERVKPTKVGLTDQAITLSNGQLLSKGQAVYQEGDQQYVLGPANTRINVGGIPLQGAAGTKIELGLGDAMLKMFGMTEAKEKGEAWSKFGTLYKDNAQLINTIDEFKTRAPNAFSGLGADTKKNISKVFSAIGVPVSEKASDTELLQAFQSGFVQKIAKNFPGSQAVKELEQLIASQPNVKQELPTIIRLLDRFRDERLADQLTYEQLSKLPREKRFETDYNILSVTNTNKIKKYRIYQELYKNKQPFPSGYTAEEAKQLQAELGLD
jgi:hypothetical protein